MSRPPEAAVEKNMSQVRIARVRRDRQPAGFTLVEVLLVLVILAIIGALVLPNILGAQDQANVRATKVQIQNLQTALDAYRIDMQTYPTTDEGLKALRTAPESAPEELRKRFRPDGYLNNLQEEAAIVDVWGTEIKYAFPGTKNEKKPDIVSAGPDKTFDTEDDIANYNVGG